MSKQDKEQVIAQFTQAYTAANGKAPQIEAKGGWYSVDGGKNMRLAQLAEMTAELTNGQTDAPAETAEAPKTTAAPKKAAPKTPKSPPKATGGFSVKDAWVAQLPAGSKSPR